MDKQCIRFVGGPLHNRVIPILRDCDDVVAREKPKPVPLWRTLFRVRPAPPARYVRRNIFIEQPSGKRVEFEEFHEEGLGDGPGLDSGADGTSRIAIRLGRRGAQYMRATLGDDLL